MSDGEILEEHDQLPPIELRTNRLVLLALDPDQLRLLLSDPQTLESQLGYRLSRAVVTKTVRRAIGLKLSLMNQVPQFDRVWFTYWLLVVDIKHSKPFGAGLIGFKGRADGNGIVEIGYGIDEKYRGQGYTTEGVQALIDWAFEQPASPRGISAQTHRFNLASGRVLEKVGMTVYAESDEVLFWIRYKPGAGSHDGSNGKRIGRSE
jgi:RimJ/RimL family protein N-acetyltransferase